MKTYDPKKCMVIFGVRQITGFAEDSMITVTPHGEGAQTYVGCDSEVARSIDPDATYDVKMSLAQTSSCNEYFSAIYNRDRKEGDGVMPLLIKDLAGTTLFAATESWIKNMPEWSRGKTIGANEWNFSTGKVDNPIVGGN